MGPLILLDNLPPAPGGFVVQTRPILIKSLLLKRSLLLPEFSSTREGEGGGVPQSTEHPLFKRRNSTAACFDFCFLLTLSCFLAPRPGCCGAGLYSRDASPPRRVRGAFKRLFDNL